jgi:hypothetical protein
MPTVRGFVQSLETRTDGWVAVAVLSVHASNTVQTLFIENLDGDLSKAHKKLAQLGLLRDALGGTLPVEISFHSQEQQGDVVDDVIVFPTRSIEGRRGANWVEGIVLGIMVHEHGPESTSSPYKDEPDVARVVLMLDAGTITTYTIDLQRPHKETGHAMLAMCVLARQTRRRIRLHVTASAAGTPDRGRGSVGDIVVGAEWPTLASPELEELVAFIERVGDRTESYDASERRTLEHVWVKYTTAPDQTPEGDRSNNGTFVPVTGVAWLHKSSDLVPRVVTALRDGLQVRLGLLGDQIHSVELTSPLGSAARPIWITFTLDELCDSAGKVCVNEPTVQAPSESALDTIPHSVAWRGRAYFTKGIWRFVVRSSGTTTLRIDCKDPCADPCGAESPVPPATPPGCGGEGTMQPTRGGGGDSTLQESHLMAHAYLHGLHSVEFVVRGYTSQSSFNVLIYRIR